MSAPGRAAAGGEEYLVVDGQELRLTNPARVLFPVTGTTKADVIAYYTAVAGVMLPHLLGRPATRKRWPDGVEGPSFFVKEVEAGIPVWLSRVQVAQGWGGKFYPVLDTPAALAWVGQVAALEVHVPQWRIGEPAGPRLTGSSRPEVLVDRVVFDLDPGEGAGLPECVDVAWALRERLGPLGNRMVPVTSGSKGLHLYVPMDAPISSEQASEWAWMAATQLEKAMPALVVSTMAKSERRGRVLVDWSQNNAAKTTIAPYSLRGRERPTVAAPRTWDELTRVGLRHLELGEVLERVAGGLDPMATLAPASPLSVVAPVVVRERRPRTARTVVGSKRRRSSDAVVLPAGLAGPVDVALAQAQDRVPGPRALPGGSTYEPKWDGFRLAVVGHADGARLWSKSGTDLTARFPEITAAAAAAVPEGTVLDGEVVIWVGDRLDFGLLQRRFTSSRARLADEARQHPASYMVFDLLAVDGQDVRPQSLRTRRALLNELARDWTPPLQRSPVTTDEQLAQQWMRQYRPAGIEGLVVKGAGTPYEPGRRRWIKVKARESTEVVIGAVVGPISAPTAVIAGLYQADGRLRMVGRSAVLTRGQAHTLARVLTAARADHPWPDSIAANLFGSGRDRVTLTRVEPVVVVEVAADAARQHGVWRHALRVLRLRADLTVAELPVLQRRDDTG